MMTTGARFIALAVGWLALPLVVRAGPATPATGADDGYVVTPVEGQSWLKRLGLSRQITAMGQMGSVGQHSSVSSPWGQSSLPEALDKPFTLTGADLYRINCQACHNIEGIGTPPEIRSLIDAVRATSPDFIRGQMERRGVTMDNATLKEMTAQADAAFRERLNHGGDRMPPFSHLAGAEIDALLDYLKRLAGVPGLRARPARVTESAIRVGEHLVKGTCFVCHDATGPGRDAIAGSPGLIPSLASFPDQNSVQSVVRKVREGAPAPGAIGLRGTMPVFSYLTREEITAAYFYLTVHPPREHSGSP
jgi:mono/diheme cytochrome c family protein